MKNGSQILLESLMEEGVDVVFGYPGGAVLPLYDELVPDGTESLFDKDENITVGRVKSWVREKEEFEVFDDE